MKILRVIILNWLLIIIAVVSFLGCSENDILTTIPSHSAVSVYLGSSQTLTASLEALVQLDTENYDNQNEFDPTTNYDFTVTVAGEYLIIGQASFAYGMPDDQLILRIKVNETLVSLATEFNRSSQANLTTSRVLVLSVSDTVTMTAERSDTDSILVQGSSNTFLSVTKLH